MAMVSSANLLASVHKWCDYLDLNLQICKVPTLLRVNTSNFNLIL